MVFETLVKNWINKTQPNDTMQNQINTDSLYKYLFRLASGNNQYNQPKLKAFEQLLFHSWDKGNCPECAKQI